MTRNGHRPSTLRSFRTLPGSRPALPVTGYVFVIDRSLSMDETDWPPCRLAAAIERVRTCIRAAAEGNPDNVATVTAFARRTMVLAGPAPCSDDQHFQAGLCQLATDQYTNIGDGLRHAARLFGEPMYQACEVKVVHLLTDGGDNCDSDPRRAARTLHELRAIVDVVGIGGDPVEVDEPLLIDIASDHPDGGKRYRFIGDAAGLAAHYKNLVGRITK